LIAAACVLTPALSVGCSPPPAADADRPIAEYNDTGRLQRLTFDSDSDGRNDAVGLMDGTRIKVIQIDSNHNGLVDRWDFYNAEGGLEKVGFSQRDDGVMDAVAFYAGDGVLLRREVSTRHDGRFDRREFYDGGVLAQVEEDTNGDGRIDKWETYHPNAGGGAGEPPSILAEATFDDTFAGRPTRRLEYRPDGSVTQVVVRGAR
jgi:hypothetical protein